MIHRKMTTDTDYQNHSHLETTSVIKQREDQRKYRDNVYQLIISDQGLHCQKDFREKGGKIHAKSTRAIAGNSFDEHSAGRNLPGCMPRSCVQAHKQRLAGDTAGKAGSCKPGVSPAMAHGPGTPISSFVVRPR